MKTCQRCAWFKRRTPLTGTCMSEHMTGEPDDAALGIIKLHDDTCRQFTVRAIITVCDDAPTSTRTSLPSSES